MYHHHFYESFLTHFILVGVLLCFHAHGTGHDQGFDLGLFKITFTSIRHQLLPPKLLHQYLLLLPLLLKCSVPREGGRPVPERTGNVMHSPVSSIFQTSLDPLFFPQTHLHCLDGNIYSLPSPSAHCVHYTLNELLLDIINN